MGAERPVLRILHPKPCAHSTYAILGYVLCAHGFAWKMRNKASSAPRLHRQSRILTYNTETYHSLVCEHTKIDAKLIFTVPDMRPNLASISGTVEMSVAPTLLGLDTSICYCLLLVGIILIRPCNFGGKLLVQLFFWTKTYVQTFTFSMRFCLGKWSSVIFFGFQSSTYCCTSILFI